MATRPAGFCADPTGSPKRAPNLGIRWVSTDNPLSGKRLCNLVPVSPPVPRSCARNSPCRRIKSAPWLRPSTRTRYTNAAHRGVVHAHAEQGFYSKNHPIAVFGQAVTGRARNGLACGTAIGATLARGQGFDGAPPQWAGHVGLRPGLLRWVVQIRAVLDADGSPPGHHEGRFTDTPPGLDHVASTPRLKHEAASSGKGRSRLVVGGWPCPCRGANR